MPMVEDVPGDHDANPHAQLRRSPFTSTEDVHFPSLDLVPRSSIVASLDSAGTVPGRTAQDMLAWRSAAISIPSGLVAADSSTLSGPSQVMEARRISSMKTHVAMADVHPLPPPEAHSPQPCLPAGLWPSSKPYFTASRYTYNVLGNREYVYDLPMDVAPPLALHTRRLMPLCEVVFLSSGARNDSGLLRPFHPRLSGPSRMPMSPPSPLCDDAMSTVALGDPEYLWCAHKQDVVQLTWSYDARTVFLVRVFNCLSGSIAGIKHCARTLEAALYALTGARGFTVISPEAGLLKMGFAASFVVLDFPPTATRYILARKAFTCPQISFFVHPRAVPSEPFVLIVDGFANTASDDIVSAVRRVLRSDDTVSTFSRSVANVHGIEEPAAPWIAMSIIDGAEVTVYGAYNESRSARAVIQCPTDSVVRWRALNRYLHGLSFPCGRFIGRPRVAVRCTGCHSIEHEAVRCPVPLISGWSGPVAGAGYINKI